VFGANYKSNEPQNGSTFHVHASKVFTIEWKKRIHCCNIYIYIYETTNVVENLKQSCEIDLQRNSQWKCKVQSKVPKGDYDGFSLNLKQLRDLK
jgi:hypothetical protein